MLINNIQTNNKINFKKMTPVKTATGSQALVFSLPYDKEKYKYAAVEFILLKKQGTNFVVDDNCDSQEIQLNQNGEIIINPSSIALKNQPFGYRFKLQDKTGNITYHTDSGFRTENAEDTNAAKYVVVFRDRAPVTNPGSPIIHLMPDNHNPGWKFDKNGNIVQDVQFLENALASKRNHFKSYTQNKDAHLNEGRGIAGIIEDIPRLKNLGFDFVLATPLFGADETSSHGYWTANPFQMTKKYGSLNHFKKLNVELFKKDMSLIADGAFVNEGMEGYRWQHVLKWGESSPYYHQFKIEGTPTIKNLPNIDPNSPKGKEILPHIKLNIVNGNNLYSFNANDIGITKQSSDSSKLTYIQIYDDRLLSPAQKKQVEAGVLIDENLSELTTKNHYDLTNDDDSVFVRKFVIPADEVKEFEARIKESKDLYATDRLSFLQTVLKFKNFNIGTQASGFETWDGNADIAKNNFIYGMATEAKMADKTLAEKMQVQQGTFQNQDRLPKIGKYWTKTVRDAHIEHSMKTLQHCNDKQGYKTLLNASKEELPKKAGEVMTDDVIENVINNKYQIPQLKTTSNVRDRLTEDFMNVPLESLGFSNDVTAVLGSPFFSFSPNRAEDIGKSRYAFSLEKRSNKSSSSYEIIYDKVDDFYRTSMVEFGIDIISRADTEGKLIDKSSQKLTDAGKLILPLISDDIVKFAMIKALAPEVKVENKGGKLVYDEKTLENITLNNIGGKGICAKSPKDEAEQTFKLMKKGFAEISSQDKDLLATNIKARFQGVNEIAAKMSYVLVDRTASGLNWRTDATKDTSPMGDVRDGLENFGSTMDETTRIWKRFADGVKEINPNAYIIAEMTDTDALMKPTNGASGRHKNNMDLESTFVHETGVSGITNYTYFFSAIMDLVSTRSDAGKIIWGEGVGLDSLKDKLIGTTKGWDANKGFLFSYPNDGVLTSHNSATNHDKPRLLSILALDNKLFHGQGDAKELEGITGFYTPEAKAKGLTPSYPAIAMAKAIDTSIGLAVDEIDSISSEQKEQTKDKLKAAIKDLAQGKFQGKEFNPEAFGVSPIDFAIKDVLLQAQTNHQLKLNPEQKEELFNKTFETILKPALAKLLIVDKIMAIMPGRPTSYSGDEYGATGSEEKAKNITLQNRNVANRNYLESINSLKNYYETKGKLNNLRKDKELSALSTGEPIMLTTGDDNSLAMFRYDTDSEIICLAHTKNIHRDDNKEEFTLKEDTEAALEKIDLTPQHKQGTVVAGLAGGLALGTYFINALNNGAKEVYGVCKEAEKYTIRRFDDTNNYEDYVRNFKTGNIWDLTKDAKYKIKLSDNIMVLKNPLKKAAKQAVRTTFGGNQNQIRVQAYLNSKQSLNTNRKNAI